MHMERSISLSGYYIPYLVFPMGGFLDRQLEVARKFTEPKLPSGKLEVIASKCLLSPS